MKKYKVLFEIITALCSLLPTILYAQVDTAWVRKYNGTGSQDDWSYDMVIDPQGNAYVTGRSPAPNGYDDCVTIKYNPSGVRQWATRYNGEANLNDEGYCIVLDRQGNVFAAGYTTINDSTTEYLTIKYNSNGETLWTRKYHNTNYGENSVGGLAVDSAGNVYVTGVSYDSSSYLDYATIKYNSAGVQQWVQRYNGPGNNWDGASSIAIDRAANVYVTGESDDSVTNSDYATIKYNTDGAQQWVARYNYEPASGGERGNAIAIDGANNIYVTGHSDGPGTDYDFATIKYDSNGVEQWVARYDGPGNGFDDANAIALDNQGNCYVTGTSTDINHYFDYATIKYDADGDTVWVRRYDGPGNRDDRAWSIAVDNHGNVYITGDSYYSDDILEDYATIKYSTDGVQRWVTRFDGEEASHDYAFKVALDSFGNVYVTGATDDTAQYDYGTIKYVQELGIDESIENGKLEIDNFSVYPNPAKTVMLVRVPLSVKEIKIFDVSGKMIKVVDKVTSPQSHKQEVRIPLKGINPGIYFLRLGKDTKKFLVVK
jgi:uncharacterized delta-60 repeat protein